MTVLAQWICTCVSVGVWAEGVDWACILWDKMRSIGQQDSYFQVSSPRRSHAVISTSIQVIISNLFCTFSSHTASLLIRDTHEIQGWADSWQVAQKGRIKNTKKRSFDWMWIHGCVWFFQLYGCGVFSSVSLNVLMHLHIDLYLNLGVRNNQRPRAKIETVHIW